MSYFIVSVPVKEDGELFERSHLAEKTVGKGLSVQNYSFQIPPLKVGTLDQLMKNSELFAKLDGKYQQMVQKLIKAFEEADKDPSKLFVGEEQNISLREYTENFFWNEGKFPLDLPLPKLEEELDRFLGQLEDKFKQQQKSMSKKRQELARLEKQAGGPLMMRDLSGFVNQYDLIDTTHIVTRLVIVPRQLEPHFLEIYGNIEEVYQKEEELREKELEARRLKEEAKKLKEAKKNSKRSPKTEKEQEEAAKEAAASLEKAAEELSTSTRSSTGEEEEDFKTSADNTDTTPTTSSSPEGKSNATEIGADGKGIGGAEEEEEEEEELSERELEFRRKTAQHRARMDQLAKECPNVVPFSALRLPNCVQCRQEGTERPPSKGSKKKGEPTVGLNGEVLADFRCDTCGLIMCRKHAEAHAQLRGHDLHSEFKEEDDPDNVLYRILVFKKGVEEVEKIFSKYRFVMREANFDQSKATRDHQAKLDMERELEKSQAAMVRWIMIQYSQVAENWIHVKAVRVFVESVLRYGLPPHFVATLINPKKGKEPQLHKALHKLYLHLDSADNVADDDDVDTGGLSAAGAPGEFYPYVFVPVEWEV